MNRAVKAAQRSGRADHPRPEQLHGSLQGPPGAQAGAGGPEGRQPARRTSPAGAARSRPRRRAFTRSTRPTAAATTARSAPAGSPWRSQIAAIEIRDEDAISDSGVEIWNLLESRGITHVMLLGVHTNMCVLGRPFGLRQLARHGKNVVLVRDLTDTMYNSRSWPYVSHFEGTNRIIEHIEKYVCPTITSTDLTGQPAFAFQPDDRPRAVFVIGDDEYKTEKTLPAFANSELEPLGVRCTFVIADPKTPHDFKGIEALDDADLHGRERSPPGAHGRADEPDPQVRGFGQTRGRNPDREPCLRRPRQGPRGTCRVADLRPRRSGRTLHRASRQRPQAQGRPSPRARRVIRSWRAFARRFTGQGSLYKTSPLAASARALLMGEIPGHPGRARGLGEPRGLARVFYTSLGHPGDFDDTSFRRLLRNAVFWALNRRVFSW